MDSGICYAMHYKAVNC